MATDRQNQALTLLAGIGIGAALMYYLDPQRGTRRRHMLADQAASRAREAGRQVRDAAVDARNEAAGMVAEVRGRLGEEHLTDEQLVARVRAELGHHVERARTIQVSADHGTVTLRGAVKADDIAEAEAAARAVRGVARVLSELTVRPREEDSVRLD